jgi:NAD(P)-dependent dehydrogenase (short-subunit alcohol dehydrogenase family)
MHAKLQMNSEELLGKVAIVTGASKGIGAAAAIDLAAHGVRVVLAARTIFKIEQLVDDIGNAGGEAMAVVCDVANYENVATLVEKAIAAFGRVDILVNNAGMIDPIVSLADSDPERWVGAADINYKGVYFGLRAVIPHMLEQGGGVIVNLSSGAATKALAGWSHYCSSKAAALSLTQCAHEEYGRHGVLIVGLSPGTVATEMQIAIRQSGINPVSQLDPSVHVPPEWVARAIVWLCTTAATEHAGTDFSLRDNDNRRKIGLID